MFLWRGRFGADVTLEGKVGTGARWAALRRSA